MSLFRLFDGLEDLPEINKSKESTLDYWKTRAEKAESELEGYKLMSLYVKELVDMWPSVTLRTLYKVTEKINTLSQTLSK